MGGAPSGQQTPNFATIVMNLVKGIFSTSGQYGDSTSNPGPEPLDRRIAMLDFDELMILRSIHGKLDNALVNRRVRTPARVGGFVW